MRKIMHGFMLIELLVYLLLASTLFCLAGNWLATILVSLKTAEKFTLCTLSTQAVHDVLVRDLRQAGASMQTWKINEHEYIWRTPHADVGWQLHEGKLIRLQGTFDYAACTWQHVHKTALSRMIETFEIRPQQHHDAVKHVTVYLGTRVIEPIKTMVMLCGGIG